MRTKQTMTSLVAKRDVRRTLICLTAWHRCRSRVMSIWIVNYPYWRPKSTNISHSRSRRLWKTWYWIPNWRHSAIHRTFTNDLSNVWPVSSLTRTQRDRPNVCGEYLKTEIIQLRHRWQHKYFNLEINFILQIIG